MSNWKTVINDSLDENKESLNEIFKSCKIHIKSSWQVYFDQEFTQKLIEVNNVVIFNLLHLLLFGQMSYTKFNSSKIFGRGYDPVLPPTKQPIRIKVG